MYSTRATVRLFSRAGRIIFLRRTGGAAGAGWETGSAEEGVPSTTTLGVFLLAKIGLRTYSGVIREREAESLTFFGYQVGNNLPINLSVAFERC